MKNKIRNIEFLKFLFALEILYFHLVHPMLWNVFKDVNLYQQLSVNSTDGQKSVDFMFIIAGFLLTYNFKNIDYITYIKKKICRLWPIVFISLLFYLLFNFRWFSLYDNIFSLLFINNIGITLKSGNNGTLWFISVFFWVSLLFFFLLKNNNKNIVSLCIAFFIWFSYSFLIHAKDGNINDQIYSFNYVFNVGLLRGLAGMGIGYFCALLYENLSVQPSSVCSKWIFTFFEIGLLVFIIYNMIFHLLNFYNDIIFIIAFVFLFWSFLNKKGYLSQILDNNLSVYLGSISFSLFIMNLPIYDWYKHTYWIWCKNFIQHHPFANIFISMGGAILISIAIHHFLENPLSNFLKSRLLSQSLQAAEIPERVSLCQAK